ncbi:MAG: MFS transporter, partial [Pseudomonadota bacterium]
SLVAAGMIGNLIEWYDFALFGYMATIISQLFFPSDDTTTSLIATYGAFAGGFVMRPVGAVFFGHIGDTIGRKSVMVLSVTLMVIPTILLGLLPTYETWGIWAPICLVVIRMIQGFSVGGEFSGSVTYLVEASRQDRRGLAGSWANCGGGTGFFLGASTPAVLMWLLGEAAVEDYGWRIPFLIGGVIGIIGLFLRRRLPELGLETNKNEKRHIPLAQVCKEEPQVAIWMLFFTVFYGAAYYIPTVYLPTWQSIYSQLTLETALFIMTLAMVLQTILIPIVGYLTDTVINRRWLVISGFALLGILAYPFFQLAEGGEIWGVSLVYVAACVLIAFMLGTVPTTLVEAFDRGHRLTGYSVCFNIGIAIGGGTAPLLCAALIKYFDFNLAPAIYLSATSLLAAGSLFLIKDRSKETLR